MIERARAKGIYDRLHRSDLVSWLDRDADPRGYDVIVAADVFNYLRDLRPALRACAERLAPGGRLAFSVEASSDRLAEGAGYQLRGNRRYAHNRERLSETIVSAGLFAVSMAADTLRQEQDRPVEAIVCLCRRGSSRRPALRTPGRRATRRRQIP